DSPSQRDFLIDEGVISGRKLHVIAEGSLAGVDLRRFDPARFSTSERAVFRARLGIPASSAIFLFMGRITREKGVFVLLEAFEQIRGEGFDAALVMVGPLDDECGGEASITAQDLHARSGVCYAGFSERPEEFMAIADILCLPSFREGFGTVVIEAAAMAVPSIGSRIVGLVDAIRDGETGLLVEPRSSAALCGAMRRLLTEPELRLRFGAAARARCAEIFDSNRVTWATAEEYRRSLVKVKGTY
ncbi:glycosyltransferase, partial [Aquamicrobium sp.]|uniref:glycosyltransferase n=1 Tax=Aquamicrobium sp. TaxID=1872579 RepID=UPI0025839CAC